MKLDFILPLRFPMKFAHRTWIIAVLTLLSWELLVDYGRGYFIKPQCVQSTEICRKELVNPIDRIAINSNDMIADAYSHDLQKLLLGMGIATPIVTGVTSFLLGTQPLACLQMAGVHFLFLAQTIGINGVLTELSHVLFQRPRPFVYQDPKTQAAPPAHYTSFYSGHTSFVGATSFAILICLVSLNLPSPLLLLFFCFGQAMTFATGYFRVMAGRHFFSDILVGALMGFIAALISAQLVRRDHSAGARSSEN